MTYMCSQGIYFRIFISDFIVLILAGIFVFASASQRFMRERNHCSYMKNKLPTPISGNT